MVIVRLLPGNMKIDGLKHTLIIDSRTKDAFIYDENSADNALTGFDVNTNRASNISNYK